MKAVRKLCAIQYILIFLIVFCFDRLTKWWALRYLLSRDIVVSSNLNLSFTWNRGISWGLFGSTSSFGFYVLTAFIIAIIGVFLAYTIMMYREEKAILCELLVLAGAFSNLWDRVVYGAVVDFVDFHILTWHWPTFNIADTCIVAGIGGMLVREFLWVFFKK